MLTAMIEDLRALLADAAAGAIDIVPYKRISWKVDRLQRRVIVCDPDRVGGTGDLAAVGFFGQRRPGTAIEPLERANRAIVREFRRYPGILSYSSWELPGQNWANLVLCSDPGVSEAWRANRLHADAVETLSPSHYLNVRIHHGSLPGGVRGGERLLLERTRYVDYRAARPWRAVRMREPGPGRADADRDVP